MPEWQALCLGLGAHHVKEAVQQALLRRHVAWQQE